ncbi:glycerol-3-phosphate 1-O-acyltransferase PlsB [Phytohalomonas tamaricis]|uniref:glycerol-3-phosphate 1-O-acyltransferase PlsB n=1 Tax=Phytohalomonas tamaricis TaxID=2081032 RepID=UPI000D0B9788|nr:glycerol-3-phosphate 1-O-acyltransferase PlsB [Phytohalomonas tamaricis]
MSLLSSLRYPLDALARRWFASQASIRSVEPAPESLALTPDIPVIYVLPYVAFSDALVLEKLCREFDLPCPNTSRQLGDKVFPHGYIALMRPKYSRRAAPQSVLSHQWDTLIDIVQQHEDSDVQLVPVTVFWRRLPNKQPLGFWKLLAADSWPITGRLKRLLAIFVNVKHLDVRFGAPLRLRPLLNAGPSDHERARRRIARLLRVHFRRTRIQVLGPDLSHRRTLIADIMKRPAVTQAIQEGAAERHQTQQNTEQRALRYGFEIASNMSAPVMLFMYQLLGRLWNRLYDGVSVNGLDEVKALARDHELVYVPCHRSHIDYLLLSYVLYDQGLMPPHIAAGRNLNMPLIGPLLRRAGAFFMRRSFNGNRLYATVFNEYLHQLLSRGHPVEYFIEGGRSRTGRMLQPRPGMLAMTLRSFARQTHRELAFIPVYIGYEKVLESGTYQKELQSGRKKKESPLDLIRVIKHLRQPFGQVHVNIGKPIDLAAFLDEHTPQWRQARAEDGKADWIEQAVPRIGNEIVTRINAAATLNPVALVAMVMLASPYQAIEVEVLKRQLHVMVALQRLTPGGERVMLPEGEPQQWINHAAALGMIERHAHPLGELIIASDKQTTSLTWYRNNILHLFAPHALVAFAFRNNSRFDLDTIANLIAPAWPAMTREFYLPENTPPRERIKTILDALTQQGLLEDDGNYWRRVAGSQEADESLDLLAMPIQPTLERGFLLLSSLMRFPPGQLTREALEEQSRLLAERLTLLRGLNAPEYFDRRLFSALLDMLEEQKWIWVQDNRLHFDTHLSDALRKSRILFDPALRHRLSQLTGREPVKAQPEVNSASQ